VSVIGVSLQNVWFMTSNFLFGAQIVTSVGSKFMSVYKKFVR